MTQLFGLSLLPLLGGFIFLRFFHLTGERSYRYSGYKLLFYSAFWGFVGDLVAIIVIQVYNDTYQLLSQKISPNPLLSYIGSIDLSPYEARPLLAIAILSLAWIPLNLLVSKTFAYRYAILGLGTYLEQVLLDAQENDHLVLVTLKNRKVYVGYVINAQLSTFRRYDTQISYLSILPVLSGFRKEEDLRIQFTTEYYEMWTDENLLVEVGLSAKDFTIILPESEIVSVNKFDYYVFQRFDTNSSAAKDNDDIDT